MKRSRYSPDRTCSLPVFSGPTAGSLRLHLPNPEGHAKIPKSWMRASRGRQASTIPASIKVWCLRLEYSREGDRNRHPAQFYEYRSLEEMRNWPCFPTRLITPGSTSRRRCQTPSFVTSAYPSPTRTWRLVRVTQIQPAAAIMTALERSLVRNRPDLALVVGDLTSTTGNCLPLRHEKLPLKDWPGKDVA